jgi:hypothetical protein
MPPRPRRGGGTAAERRRIPGRGRRRPRPGGGADRNRARLRGGAVGPARRRAAGGAAGTGHPAVFEAEREARPLLAVLQSIQSAPGPLLLLHPDGPVGTARAGMIVADVTPAVAREAQALRAQLEELASLRAVQEAGLTSCRTVWPGFRRRAPTCRRPSPTAERCRRRFRSMPTLCRRSFKAPCRSTNSPRSCANSQAARPTISPISPPRGGACRPRSLGTVLRRFNEADAAGVARPGVVLATRIRMRW